MWNWLVQALKSRSLQVVLAAALTAVAELLRRRSAPTAHDTRNDTTAPD